MAGKQGQSFGASAERKEDYANFLQRFESSPTSISMEEATSRYRELIGHVSPKVAADVNTQIIGHLPADDRQQLGLNVSGASTAAQAGVLDQVLGKDSVLNSPLGRLLLSAAVAYLARRVLGGGTQQSSGGLGDILGSVLGGQTSGGGGGLGDILGGILSGGGAPQQQPSSSGGLGDILGGILGGNQDQGQPMPRTGPSSSTQQPDTSSTQHSSGGLGDILGGILGGNAGGGGGLGDILGGLLGGQASSDEGQPAPRTGPATTTPSTPDTSTAPANDGNRVVLGRIRKEDKG